MTSNEDLETAKLVRSGAYYKDALSWYQAVYIGPISERSFFLIIGGLAGLIGLIALASFIALMPIHARPGVLVKNGDVSGQVFSLSPLRARGQSLNDAMLNFYINAYVGARESYVPSQAEVLKAFASAHSDPGTLSSYLAQIDPANPQSPQRSAGTAGQRLVEPVSISMNKSVEPPIAQVQYYTYDGERGQSPHLWQVTLGYYYTPMEVKEVVDKDSGQTIIRTEEPQFQVVQYERQPLTPTK